MESNGGINLSKARESGDYEPTPAEFLEKMCNENVWHRFMRDLTVNNTARAIYNNWDETSGDEGRAIFDSSNSSDDQTSTSNGEDENHYLKAVQINPRKRLWFDSDDDETDDNLAQQNKRMRCHSNHDDDDFRSNDIILFPQLAELMKKKIQKIKRDFESYCEQLRCQFEKKRVGVASGAA